MSTDDWSEEDVAYIKEHYRSKSAAQIGAVLKRSRSAVCAKAKRLGMSKPMGSFSPGPRRPRTAAERPTVPRKPKPAPSPRQSSLDAIFKAAAFEPAHKVLEVSETPPPLKDRVGVHNINELRDCQCRWPIGDPLHKDFYFCPRDKVSGLPYCEQHARMAYQPPQTRPRVPAERQRAPSPGRELTEA